MRSFQRGIEIGDMQDKLPAELFFCVGVGTVLDVPFAAAQAERRTRRGQFQPAPPAITPASDKACT